MREEASIRGLTGTGGAPGTHTVNFDFPDRQIERAVAMFEQLIAMKPLDRTNPE